MKKVKLIYNPNSGEKKILSNLDTIIELYQEKNYLLIPYRLTIKEPVKNAFKEVDSSYEHILIAGGDGTVDLVVNAMKELDIKIPIGILPTGTANDFSNALQISFGRISYYIKGIEEALYMRKFKIKVSSEEMYYDGDMYLMLIFNGKTAGNINLAYKAEIDDGYLDVIIFKGMPIPKSIPVLISVLRGDYLDQYNGNEILYFKTKKVHIECEDSLITDIDGEKGPDFPLNIECIKDGIEVMGICSEKS
ncbi:TPA: lipid kinase [Clostridioides difficile]|nr:lipid kinase [Clostridioides difficile]HBF6480860.1 lipid kinase [Clostridioides difficile]HBF6527009.1 lipid kinase [Clostridioides difficile]HBG7857302.1 lipid kinase [Clostridioides difficile]